MQKIIDGVRLGYDVAGTGPALVLLHGFPLDRTIWDAPFGALAGRCRVIRPDFRGSGESACGEGPALMETLAGDVFGLLDALGVERVILAGHSMGGYVALAFFRMYAERVAGLALVASHAAADSAARRAARDTLGAALEARGAAALNDAIDAMLPGLLGPRAAADAALVARVRVIMARQSPAGAAAQVLGMKLRVGSEDLLEDIAVPAAIVIGDRDPLITLATAEGTAAAIAGCAVECIAGAGHLPMLEAPQATTAALERLIVRCASTA
jgi:pimeloyl-ACP methyl ester carboxylesterase